MDNVPSQPLELFYCYADEDIKQQRKLDTYLAGLKEQGLIQTWKKEAISPGELWKEEIAGHLTEAHIILLLISADFIASEKCNDEMKIAIERHQEKKAQEKKAYVIQVLLRDADWEGASFHNLPILPSNGQPIANWSNKARAYTDVAKGVRRAVNEILGNAPEKLLLPPNPWISRIPPFPRPFLIGMSVLMVCALLAIQYISHPQIHLKEQSPYCHDSNGANWKEYHPQALCSNLNLMMHQTILKYSEVDLDTVGGSSYNLTDFSVTVQATLQSQDDGETYAALIVQTPEGQVLPGDNEGGYVLAVKPTGAWQLQHIPDFQSPIQSGRILSLNPARPITIGIVGKNNVLNLYIYQGGAPIAAQQPVFSYSEPDNTYTSAGIVGLMVQHDAKPYSSLIQFADFTLDIPG